MNLKRNALYGAVRGIVCAGTAASLALASGLVFAQDQEDEEGVELDRVVVTGSRIARTDLEGVSPVVTITREDLLNSGQQNLQDYIRYLPVANGNNADDFNNSFANGTSTINLRALGGNATLTLLNGRRISPYGQGQNITEAFVDLNSIPFDAIERVEILLDGASAIYGADAVAGVVNVILRQDFEGAQFQVSYQTDAEGDAPQTQASVIFGGGNDRTQWTTIFNYLSRDALFMRDRDFSETADFSLVGGADIRSSAGYPGTVWDISTFDGVGGDVFPGEGCGTLPGTPFDSEPSGAICRLNYNDFINIYPSSERFSMYNMLKHEISDNVQLYWDFFWNYNNTRNTAAPAPFFGPYTGTLEELPDGLLDDPAYAWGSAGGTQLFLPGTNPNNPYGYDVFLRHRAISLGPRIGDINSTSIFNTTGITGFIGDSRWDYDAGLTYSQSKVLVENRNAQDAAALQRFFIGAPDPAGSGETLYYNPFAPEQDPRVENAISIIFENRNQFDELTFYAQTTGPLWEFSTGEIGAAFGLEWREQSLSAEADPLRNSGGLVGTGRASDTTGQRDVASAYAEVLVPLGPVELSLAGRYEDYSDFGDVTVPKLGVKWTVFDGLLVRASWGESFRAPSLFELFGGVVSSFPSGLFDPARCIDPDAGPGENGNPSDLDPRDCGEGQHQVDSGGNPNLQPEESDNYNVGIIWEATEGLVFDLNYWNYDYQERIIQPATQAILNTNDPNFVIRSRPNDGPVVRILNTFINGGKIETDGIDFQIDWTFEGLGGLWRLRNFLTYTMTYERTNENGVVLDSLGGRFDFDLPEYRNNFNVNYSRGNHFFQGIVLYRSGIEDHFNSMNGSTLGGAENTLENRCGSRVNSITGALCDTDSITTFDFNYTYNIESIDSSVQVGCINCFDEDPVDSIWGTDTARYFTSLDDPRGLVLFARYTQNF